MSTVLEDAIEAARTFFEDDRISKRSIQRACKERKYSRPRHFVAAFIRARDPNRFSYPMIARFMNRKDHTTALYHERKAHEIWGRSLFTKLAAVRPVEPTPPETPEQLIHRTASEEEILRQGELNLHKWLNGDEWRLTA